jgi:protein-tyrosine phosphatase
MRILFVCMGNICRSPTAESVFRERARSAALHERLHFDSAGTHDYHVGRPPDRRAREAAARRGYDLSTLRARQVAGEDLLRYDRIYAMDLDNLAALGALAARHGHKHGQAGGARIGLLLDACVGLWTREVPDPYYGGAEGFETVLDLFEQVADALLAEWRASGSP